jgi:hypothetical protein
MQANEQSAGQGEAGRTQSGLTRAQGTRMEVGRVGAGRVEGMRAGSKRAGSKRAEGLRPGLTALKVILGAGILSTAIHYTHNFIAVSHYPGPKSLYTAVRILIVVAWPLLTYIGLTGYRRYREGRDREARVCLSVYSLTGLATLGHFLYGNPHIPAFFYATLFTDALTGLAVLGFVAWSAGVDAGAGAPPAPERAGTAGA